MAIAGNCGDDYGEQRRRGSANCLILGPAISRCHVLLAQRPSFRTEEQQAQRRPGRKGEERRASADDRDASRMWSTRATLGRRSSFWLRGSFPSTIATPTQTSNPDMKLTVKSLQGGNFSLEAEPTDTVSVLELMCIRLVMAF